MVAISALSSTRAALRSLQILANEIQTTQARIGSGLRVAAAKDDPTAWSASVAIRSTQRGWGGVQTSLSREASRIAAANAAGETTRSILDAIRAQLVAARVPNADMGAIQTRIAALNAQLNAALAASGFDGVNLLAFDSDVSGAASPHSFLAGVSESGGRTRIHEFSLDPSAVRLFDAGRAANGILQRPFDASGIATNGAAPTLSGFLREGRVVGDGVAQPAPSSLGLSGTGQSVVADDDAARAAQLAVTVQNSGDINGSVAIEMSFAMDGAAKTIRIDTRNITSPAVARQRVQDALDAQFGSGVLTADVSASWQIRVAATAAREQTLSAGNAVAIFANGSSRTLNLASTLDRGRNEGPSASYTTGTNFAETLRFGGGNALAFELTVGGVAKSVRIDALTVETALAGTGGYVSGSGEVGSLAQYAVVMRQALAEAGIGSLGVAASGQRLQFTKTGPRVDGDTVGFRFLEARAGHGKPVLQVAPERSATELSASGTIAFDVSLDGGARRTVEVTRRTVDAALGGVPGYVAGSGRIADPDQMARVVTQALADAQISGISVAADRGRLLVTRTGAGAGSLEISGLRALSGAFEARELRLDRIDLQSASFRQLRADQTRAVIDAMVAGVDARTRDVVAAEAYLGGTARRIEIQSRFAAALQDIHSTRLGQLVDANLTEERARLAALGSRQELALQALQMLNASQANILRLFR